MSNIFPNMEWMLNSSDLLLHVFRALVFIVILLSCQMYQSFSKNCHIHVMCEELC